jgi:hypothetical protein
MTRRSAQLGHENAFVLQFQRCLAKVGKGASIAFILSPDLPAGTARVKRFKVIRPFGTIVRMVANSDRGAQLLYCAQSGTSGNTGSRSLLKSTACGR